MEIMIACLLLFFYGLRLSGYLFLRERKSAAYRTVLNPEMERSKKMPMIAKVSIWVSCGFLYTLMTIPLYFRLENHAAPDPALWIGVVIRPDCSHHHSVHPAVQCEKIQIPGRLTCRPRLHGAGFFQAKASQAVSAAVSRRSVLCSGDPALPRKPLFPRCRYAECRPSDDRPSPYSTGCTGRSHA